MAATTAAVVSIAATAATTGMSFAQAGKQNKLRRQAEADAMEALSKARQKLDVNFYEQLALNKEPYELAREAMLVQGAQATEAARESERGVAATAGRLYMSQQDAQNQIRAQMGQDLNAIERLAIAEESRLRDAQANLDLAEAQGAQSAAAAAQKASAAAMEQGFKGVASLGQQVMQAAPLYEKSASAKQFSNLEQAYSQAAKAGTLDSQFLGADKKPIPFQQAITQMGGYGFDVAGVGKMKPFEFQDYMLKQDASYLKNMGNYFTKQPASQNFTNPNMGPFDLGLPSPASGTPPLLARPLPNSTNYTFPSWMYVGGY